MWMGQSRRRRRPSGKVTASGVEEVEGGNGVDGSKTLGGIGAKKRGTLHAPLPAADPSHGTHSLGGTSAVLCARGRLASHSTRQWKSLKVFLRRPHFQAYPLRLNSYVEQMSN